MVGVEGAETGVTSFFLDNKIDHKCEEMLSLGEGGRLFSVSYHQTYSR